MKVELFDGNEENFQKWKRGFIAMLIYSKNDACAELLESSMEARMSTGLAMSSTGTPAARRKLERGEGTKDDQTLVKNSRKLYWMIMGAVEESVQIIVENEDFDGVKAWKMLEENFDRHDVGRAAKLHEDRTNLK